MNPYIEILRPGNAVMGAITIILIALIDRSISIPLVLAMLTVFFETAAGNVINDYFDYKIDSDKISVDFYGDTTNLEELSGKYNVSQMVNVHGKISHKEVLQNQMNSDILLLISWMDESEKMFIPGKVYEYMASRKPILSIGYSEGSLKEHKNYKSKIIS